MSVENLSPPVIIGPVLPVPLSPLLGGNKPFGNCLSAPNGIPENFAACAAVPDPPNCGGKGAVVGIFATGSPPIGPRDACRAACL